MALGRSAGYWGNPGQGERGREKCLLASPIATRGDSDECARLLGENRLAAGGVGEKLERDRSKTDLLTELSIASAFAYLGKFPAAEQGWGKFQSVAPEGHIRGRA